MKLKLNLVSQPKDSVECGIACTTMILNYLNINVSYNDVYLGLHKKLTENGLSSAEMAAYLIKDFDLRAEVITLNPLLLSINEIGASADQIRRRIENRQSTLNLPNDINISNHFLNLLDIGGLITAEIPTFKRIKDEIDNGNPLIAGLTTNFLRGEYRFNFHYNVIIGYDEEFIYSLDPENNEPQGYNKYPIDQFLFAMHSTCYGDLDNAALIKITKK